jgi:hypothetical protein
MTRDTFRHRLVRPRSIGVDKRISVGEKSQRL